MIATNVDDVCKRTFVHYAMESDPPFYTVLFNFLALRYSAIHIRDCTQMPAVQRWDLI